MPTHQRTSFGVLVEEADGVAVVHLEGELDMGSAPDLLAAVNDLLERGVVTVVLDLRELRFLDSSGLSTLLLLSKKAAALGGTVTLRSPSTRVEQVLQVTGLDQYFRQH